MTTLRGVLTKSAVFGSALALAGLSATTAHAAPAFVNLTTAEASPIYSQPSSSSTRYRTEPRGTTLRIQCSTTQTPSGNLWYRIYDSQPTAWVWSGHFPSLVHPPKECF
ncbi:SH3 domain-containing protein [Streptomyces sp. 4F14]|uniref:SH3 domain-containing protein n=1 Tax=Streptomyces sp. 4F14 TaxID=3394380 RepID=UPI003A857276